MNNSLKTYQKSPRTYMFSYIMLRYIRILLLRQSIQLIKNREDFENQSRRPSFTELNGHFFFPGHLTFQYFILLSISLSLAGRTRWHSTLHCMLYSARNNLWESGKKNGAKFVGRKTGVLWPQEETGRGQLKMWVSQHIREGCQVCVTDRKNVSLSWACFLWKRLKQS